MTSVLENKLKKVNDVLKNTEETADVASEHAFVSGEREFVSGEVVAPGVYVDVESGAVVRVSQADELPEGRMIMRYDRRFRRIETLLETTDSPAKAA